MGAEIKIRSDGITTGWGGTDLSIELPTAHKSAVKASSGLSVAGVQSHTNASGGYINGRNTVVKAVTAAASSTLTSGAIYVPANSVLRAVTVVVTTLLDRSTTLKVGTRVGTASGDDTYALIQDDALAANGSADVGVGVGTSSDTVLAADLAGNAAIALRANYIATAGEVHVDLVCNTGNIATGAVSFVVEFDYLGGN